MTADNTTAMTANGTTPNGTSTSSNNTTPRTKICVFCGASAGNSPEYMEAARHLARAMAANDIDLVYGGGTVGLMGEVARTLCELKGPAAVHGIIPEALVKYERDGTYQTVNKDNQVVPDEATYGRTTVVRDMHTRKKLMAEEVFAGGPGSGFIGLPGGYGTMEELFEVITWNQLGIHKNGICLLNINGYYQGILDWINKAGEEDFVREANKNIVVTATTGDEAITLLRDYQPSAAIYKLQWGSQ